MGSSRVVCKNRVAWHDRLVPVSQEIDHTCHRLVRSVCAALVKTGLPVVMTVTMTVAIVVMAVSVAMTVSVAMVVSVAVGITKEPEIRTVTILM
mmetsp:Transcript_36740/g.97863  ORF Transcript_36740/g.97863 Transcript_36740/m.97863 type:complete len:94 (+) Transcript_36740:266-547(+)